MIQTKPGEVWWIDLGVRAKFRPLMLVSREDPSAERALSVYVPCTTTIKGGDYRSREANVHRLAEARASNGARHNGHRKSK